jgi:hypothetical protein
MKSLEILFVEELTVQGEVRTVVELFSLFVSSSRNRAYCSKSRSYTQCLHSLKQLTIFVRYGRARIELGRVITSNRSLAALLFYLGTSDPYGSSVLSYVILVYGQFPHVLPKQEV